MRISTLHSELCVTARDKEVEGHAGMPCGGLYLAARGEEVEGCIGVGAKEETVPGSKSPRETKLKRRRQSAVVQKGPSKSSGQVARLASSCAGIERRACLQG